MTQAIDSVVSDIMPSSPDDRDPTGFKRRVLVTVAGMSPQIVTETVFALAVTRKPRFVPTRLVVLTTAEGADRARLTLLGDNPGWFKRLCTDYGLEGIAFSQEDIVVLRDQHGAPMKDIRSEDDNVAAMDHITDAIRELTLDDDCALHVSIAGGRKTMGFFAAYALSLYGRPQDRASHVLVSEGFEGNPNFYYPTPYQHVIYDAKDRPLDAALAEVSLAELPLVRLRHGVPEPLRTGSAPMSQVVAALQRRFDPPQVVIDLRGRTLTVDGVPVPMPLQYLAYYAWVARVSPTPRPISKGAAANQALIAISASYNRVRQDALSESVELGDPERLSQFKGHVNAKLRPALSRRLTPDQLAAVMVQSQGSRGNTAHCLGLPASAITIIDP